MHIRFSPSLRDAPWSGSVSGSVVTIDGVGYDLATPDLTCDWIEGAPELIGGVWHVTLILPHGPQAPQETRFPEPVDIAEGPIPLPDFGYPSPEPEPDPEPALADED